RKLPIPKQLTIQEGLRRVVRAVLAYIHASECLNIRCDAGTDKLIVVTEEHAARTATFERSCQWPIGIALATEQQRRGFLLAKLGAQFGHFLLKCFPIWSFEGLHRTIIPEWNLVRSWELAMSSGADRSPERMTHRATPSVQQSSIPP